MLECNIGVICCPRAALSMWQNRALNGPTHNSIARVLEMALAGVWVRLGTDNIADMFETTSGTMPGEVRELVTAIRFADPHVLAKLATGTPLNESNKEVIRRHLRENVKRYRATDPSFQFCMDLD